MIHTRILIKTLFTLTIFLGGVAFGQPINYNTYPGAGFGSGRVGIGTLIAGNIFNPQDLLHIHGWTVGGAMFPFYYDPIFRISLEDPSSNPSRLYGQLGMQNFDERVNPNPVIQTKILSSFAKKFDLVLSTSKEFVPEYFIDNNPYIPNPYTYDLIISSRSPKGSIRFATTQAVTDGEGEVLKPQAWQEDKERMTIIQNGDVGVGNNIPMDRIHISNFGIEDDPLTTNMVESNGNLLIGAGNWPHIKSNSKYSLPNVITNPPPPMEERRINDGVAAALSFIPGQSNNPETTGGIALGTSKYGLGGSAFTQGGLDPQPGNPDHGHNLWLSYRKLELWHGTRGVQFRVTAPISHQSSDAGTGWTYIKSRTLIGTEGTNGSGNITHDDQTPTPELLPLTQNLMLGVNGAILCKELLVKLNAKWSDFVFNDDYKLMPLDEVENYINENNHLPGIPSAAVVEKQGVNVGDMHAKLLQKIEELTLYVIELKKENELMSLRIDEMSK